jgi:thiamine-phosphate pyrophosphorylase
MNADCLRLYLATDSELTAERDLCDLVARAITAGVTCVQLRDKVASGQQLYLSACRLHAVTQRLGVPLIINDRVDIMLAAGAEGVHVGATDLPLARVRALAAGRLVGYSVTAAADVEVARRDGADYVGIGPVFPTSTKPDASPALGLAGLRDLAAAAGLPCVAIGGITPANCAAVLTAGANGVCAISAILGHDDIGAAVQRFRAALDA